MLQATQGREPCVSLLTWRLDVVLGARTQALPLPEGTCLKSGKSVPLQTWSGPEGSRKLRFPDLMTTAQDGGKVVSLTHSPPLPPGNAPGTHFC